MCISRLLFFFQILVEERPISECIRSSLIFIISISVTHGNKDVENAVLFF